MLSNTLPDLRQRGFALTVIAIPLSISALENSHVVGCLLNRKWRRKDDRCEACPDRASLVRSETQIISKLPGAAHVRVIGTNSMFQVLGRR
jgi:hypothetical protein